MKTPMTFSKDNLLMTTLVVTGLVMAMAGSAITSQDTASVMKSAGRIVQSVSTPAAMESSQDREAAIIATAPHIRAAI